MVFVVVGGHGFLVRSSWCCGWAWFFQLIFRFTKSKSVQSNKSIKSVIQGFVVVGGHVFFCGCNDSSLVTCHSSLKNNNNEI